MGKRDSLVNVVWASTVRWMRYSPSDSCCVTLNVLKQTLRKVDCAPLVNHEDQRSGTRQKKKSRNFQPQNKKRLLTVNETIFDIVFIVGDELRTCAKYVEFRQKRILRFLDRVSQSAQRTRCRCGSSLYTFRFLFPTVNIGSVHALFYIIPRRWLAEYLQHEPAETRPLRFPIF